MMGGEVLERIGRPGRGARHGTDTRSAPARGGDLCIVADVEMDVVGGLLFDRRGCSVVSSFENCNVGVFFSLIATMNSLKPIS